MYVLLIFATFLDIPKKLLVIANVLHMDFRDVYFVLAVPPVMLLGMVTHYLACFALRVRQMTKRDTTLFIIATLLVATTAIIALVKGGVGMQALKPLANTSAYYGLIFVLPLALPGVVDVQKFFRFALIIMIPAALHALWHFWFGLFDFEHKYMESGFSINLKYLLWGEGIFGPFSAQGPLATSMAICAAICLSPFFLPRTGAEGIPDISHRHHASALCVVCHHGSPLAQARTRCLSFRASCLDLVVLRSGLLTIATYGIVTTTLVVLVVSGEDIAYELAGWQNWLYDLFGTSGAKADLLRVRTFHVRLMDFHMLADGNNWTPFGAEIAQGEGGFRAHALLVRFVMQYGYVPVGTVVAHSGAERVFPASAADQDVQGQVFRCLPPEADGFTCLFHSWGIHSRGPLAGGLPQSLLFRSFPGSDGRGPHPRAAKPGGNRHHRRTGSGGASCPGGRPSGQPVGARVPIGSERSADSSLSVQFLSNVLDPLDSHTSVFREREHAAVFRGPP